MSTRRLGSTSITAMLCFVIAVTIGGQSSAAGVLPHTVRVAAPCSTSGLAVWIQKPPGNAALGSRYFFLQFTNLSGHTCTLHGAPGVSPVSLRGDRLGAPAAHGKEHHPAQVLHNRATVSSLLKITIAAAIGGCRPRLAAGLRVYPPNQVASKVVPFPVRACLQTFMSVSEVEPAREIVEYP